MSRAPPFPTRRRAPSLTNSNAYQTQPLSAPGTSTVRPLQISRPPSRSATPVNGSFTSASSPVLPPNSAPIGPSRPQRSELRARTSEYSEHASTQSQELYRDTADSSPPHNRPKLTRLQSVHSDDGQENTPTSLTSALSAFQSAGSRRRKMTLDEEDLEYHRERENELEAEKQRQQRLRDRVPGMRSTGISKAGDIDAVLDQVKDGWEFVINPDFNTVDLALQLLDESSLGKDIESFKTTKNLLSKALQSSVDKHYQAFATSLPHHASLLNHLASVQSQISNTRSALFESKEALGNKRADLVQLWSRSQILDEMIKMLDQIEHLKTIPDMLETLISEKRLLQASVVLVRAVKIINKPDMLEIGAVADLRSYLITQEAALCDILIDEIQSHLYLKSFWCESRWASYVPSQQSFRRPEFEEEPDQRYGSNPSLSPSVASLQQSRLTRFLNDLALRPNDPPYDLNTAGTISNMTSLPLNSAVNPEADSFAYMETLLESLAVLGKLGTALDTVAQRVSGELFTLVDGTVGEVEERAEFGRRKTITFNSRLGKAEGVYILSSTDSNIAEISASHVKGRQVKASHLRLSALEPSTTRLDHEILKDLFWTLYSKLDAVAQGFRVIFEVANRIGSRRDFKDPSGTKPGAFFPLSEMWNPVEAEVRTLIYDYLTDEQQGSATGRNPISSINEILREGKFPRDKIKPVFRFNDTDIKATNKALKPHEDGLTRVLKDTMPGLVPPSIGDTIHTTALTNVSTEERMLGIDQHHRLLIRPDAFHVTVLFQPTLCFLERIADVLPSGLQSARASSTVLDDFVIKAYLPQLEEKVLELFHQAVTGVEAFRSDPFSLHFCPHPLIKASIQLLALVNSLCTMLCSSPFHRESYTRLILAVVIQFYQRCSDRFQSLTSNKSLAPGLEPKLALAGHWIQRSELNTCLTELFTSMTDNAKIEQLCRQETHIEAEFLGSKNLSRDDLIPSMRHFAALASLYRSVAWFSSELMALKANSEDVTSPTGHIESLSAITPYTPHLPALPSNLSSGELQLPLSREMNLRFQALLKTYEQLSRMILDTIRVDLRCRVIFYIESVFREASHAPSHEVVDPDESVVHLNTELIRCDESLRTSLAETERRYIFAGLADLIEHTIISSARFLLHPNQFGIRLILKDIQALQQSIKILVEDDTVDFERSKAYYSLFFISPQEMIDGIRQKQLFTFDEYQTMLNLQCGVKPLEGEMASTQVTDRNYSMYVIDLHGLEIDR
ncbi:exocyst complex component sec8 [Cyathus striatus]|nr:exocyst complex component sec8 [Cyathus striatus]